MTTIPIERELLERVIELLDDKYPLRRHSTELRALLAEQPQDGAGQAGPVVPDGYVIVPLRATHEMAMAMKAQLDKSPVWYSPYKAAYSAALYAAPQPAARQVGQCACGSSEPHSATLRCIKAAGNAARHDQANELRRLREALELIADTDPDDGTSWFHDVANAALSAHKTGEEE